MHFEASGVAPNTDTMPGMVYLDVSNTLELFCFFLGNIFSHDFIDLRSTERGIFTLRGAPWRPYGSKRASIVLYRLESQFSRFYQN